MDKKRIGDLFSRRAGKYGESIDHVGGADLGYLEKFLQGKQIDAALDVSTGSGHTAGLLKRHCSFVVAVDIAQGMLVESRRRYGGGNISFVGGDSECLPFKTARFSLVTCRIAPHHFSNIPAFLRETGRVLREGGFFMLSDSTVPEERVLAEFIHGMEKLRDETHARSLTISEWDMLLADAGFRVIDRKVFRKKHDFQPWLERTLPSRERKAKLIDMIGNAEKGVREYFQFEIQRGEILSYTDDKALFLTTKEGDHRPDEK